MAIELYAVKHHYSCGGYWLAKHLGDNKFLQMSPNSGIGAVSSKHQILLIKENIEKRGEVVHLYFVDELPEGAILIK